MRNNKIPIQNTATVPYEMQPSLEYVIAKDSDREAVHEALANFFYPEEPLTHAHRDGPTVTEDDMENSLSFLSKGTVVLARTVQKATDSPGRIVGFSIGGPSLCPINVPVRTRKFGDIMGFLERLGDRADRNKKTSYNIHMLAVHPSYRGQSIGRRLIEEQIALVHKRWSSLRIVTAEATGPTSLRLLKRIGMRETGRLGFEDYRDDEGHPIFLGTSDVIALEMNL